ncbi:MAG: hypothetical protein GEU97_16875 [Actinophytocola sp.]|nr:hypothetical protein [Actinophytocola sp.]
MLHWLEDFVANLLRDELLTELESRLNEQLVADIPEVATDAGIRRDLEASTHDILRAFLVVSAKDPTADLDFPRAALDLARTLAKRRHDVGLLLRMYRVGQRVFWRELMRIVSEEISDPDLRMAALEFLWDRMSRVLERNIDVLVAAHSEESEHCLRGVRKTETVHAILRDEQTDGDKAAACSATSLPDRDGVVGVRLGRRSHRQAGHSPRQPPATALGAPTPLTIQAGARVMWAWLATGSDPELRRIADVPTLRRATGLRVAVGVPARGLRRFRESHREAIRAQAVAVDSGGRNALTLYRDVEIISCLSTDQEAMRALVSREIGGLVGVDPAAAARLRGTALAYLRAGSSARAAADGLGVHNRPVSAQTRRATARPRHRRTQAVPRARAHAGGHLRDRPVTRRAR